MVPGKVTFGMSLVITQIIFELEIQKCVHGGLGYLKSSCIALSPRVIHC